MPRINRKAHLLKREKKITIPRHVIFFDTETTQVELTNGTMEHSLSLGWACYYRKERPGRPRRLEWFYFTRSADFWSWVLERTPIKNRLWLMAHNLSFDFTIVDGLNFLQDAGFKLAFFYCNGLTTIIKVKAPKRSLLCVDSCNYFTESLAELAARFKIEKLQVDAGETDISYMKRACKQHVKILVAAFESLAGFLTSKTVGRLAYTIGSTAWSAFLTGCYRESIYIHNDVTALNMERESYRGGRVECFYLGELNHGPYHLVDVNSLYASVMFANYFPCRYEKILHDPTSSVLRRCLKDKAVVAKVMLDTDQPY